MEVAAKILRKPPTSDTPQSLAQFRAEVSMARYVTVLLLFHDCTPKYRAERSIFLKFCSAAKETFKKFKIV